jgi:tRNA(Ile2) C34 agmatinyltransferase TiaS
MKLSKRSIRIKELIGDQVDMGTFGLVELELQAFDKEIAELKNCNLQNVSNPVCPKCGSANNTGMTYDGKYCCLDCGILWANDC